MDEKKHTSCPNCGRENMVVNYSISSFDSNGLLDVTGRCADCDKLVWIKCEAMDMTGEPFEEPEEESNVDANDK